MFVKFNHWYIYSVCDAILFIYDGEIGGYIRKTMGSVRLDGQMIQFNHINEIL